MLVCHHQVSDGSKVNLVYAWTIEKLYLYFRVLVSVVIRESLGFFGSLPLSSAEEDEKAK